MYIGSCSTSLEAKFDIKNKIYAQINNKSFQNNIDFEKAIESLKVHTGYQSIEEIIESQAREDFPGDKLTFKVDKTPKVKENDIVRRKKEDK